jgi:peroxiredoxin Q/BCP
MILSCPKFHQNEKRQQNALNWEISYRIPCTPSKSFIMEGFGAVAVILSVLRFSLVKLCRILSGFCLAVFLVLSSSWCTNTEAIAIGGKMPPLDRSAPEFSLPSNTGERTVSLSDYRGQWLVLYFYPEDLTRSCTIEARRFKQDLPRYQARNAQIVGVSADSTDSHADFCDAQDLQFPLLADTEGKVSKAYDSWLGVRSLRHTYIIDPDGILRATFVGVRPAIHSQEVLARLHELQS